MNRIYLLLVGLLTCLYVGAEDKLTLSTSGNNISIGLDNETSFTAFQMDVIIPQGLTKTAVTPASRIASSLFEVDSEMIESNVLRVIAHNTDNQAIDGNAGELVNIALASTLKTTDKVEVKNIRFVKTNNLSEMLLADVSIAKEDPVTPEEPDDFEYSTDVSLYTNALYFNDVESRPGDFDLALNMKCAAENITAFQCDVYLPEGVEWKSTTDKRGNIVYDKPAFNEDRTDESYHTIDVAKNDDGSFNIIVYSMDLVNILETDGAIMTLPLTISEDMEKKDYNIFLKKIVLTDVNEQQTLIDKMVSKLTIPSYKLGDANGDNLINVTDVVSTIGYIRGKAGNNFVFGAADVNEDTQINVTDIVGIIRLIRSGARTMPAKKPHVHKVIR